MKVSLLAMKAHSIIGNTKNWPSAYWFARDTRATMLDDAQHGGIVGPFTQPSLKHSVASPMGAFRKKSNLEKSESSMITVTQQDIQ